MNFLSKIFSSNQEKIPLLDKSTERFSELSIAEMEAVLGGRPLVNPLDERKKNNHENFSQEI